MSPNIKIFLKVDREKTNKSAEKSKERNCHGYFLLILFIHQFTKTIFIRNPKNTTKTSPVYLTWSTTLRIIKKAIILTNKPYSIYHFNIKFNRRSH